MILIEGFSHSLNKVSPLRGYHRKVALRRRAGSQFPPLAGETHKASPPCGAKCGGDAMHRVSTLNPKL